MQITVTVEVGEKRISEIANNAIYEWLRRDGGEQIRQKVYDSLQAAADKIIPEVVAATDTAERVKEITAQCIQRRIDNNKLLRKFTDHVLKSLDVKYAPLFREQPKENT
jgi:thymidylate kinase